MNPQDTLHQLISLIVDPKFSADFQVDQTESDLTGITQLKITAPQNAIGQIIGKQGKIIKALRILMAIAFPDQRFNIQINEN